jgi:putative transposase
MAEENAIAKPRYSEKQILAALDEAEAGASVSDLCRRLGIADTTFYRWREKHGAPKASESKRLQELEEENRRLKLLVAELTLRNQALKLVVSKKW